MSSAHSLDHVRAEDISVSTRVIYRSHPTSIGYTARVTKVLRAAAEIYVDDPRWNGGKRDTTIRFNKLFIDRSAAEQREEVRQREVAIKAGVTRRPSIMKLVNTELTPPEKPFIAGPPIDDDGPVELVSSPEPQPEKVRKDDIEEVEAWLALGKDMVTVVDKAIENEQEHIAMIEDQIAALEAEREAAGDKLGMLRKKRELLSKLAE